MSISIRPTFHDTSHQNTGITFHELEWWSYPFDPDKVADFLVILKGLPHAVTMSWPLNFSECQQSRLRFYIRRGLAQNPSSRKRLSNMKSFDVLECCGIGQHEKKALHKRVHHFALDFRGKKLRMNKTLNDSNAHNLVQHILCIVVGLTKVSNFPFSFFVGTANQTLGCFTLNSLHVERERTW